MTTLPTAILFDLDDTILSAFGRAPDQWRRVIAAFADQLEPHPPDDIIDAFLAYSRYLWADEMRHKALAHRIGEARRHIVANAFAELCAARGSGSAAVRRFATRSPIGSTSCSMPNWACSQAPTRRSTS